MIRTTSRILWFAAMLATATVLSSSACARPLQGVIFMCDGFQMVIEVKEGTISEMLRFMHVTSSPREKVNLSRLSANGDRLFIGTDYCLYCQKKVENGASDTEIYKIGRAHKLWEIRLLEGVKLSEVESVLGSFTGEGGQKALKVELGKAEKKGSDVEPAGMKFWLDEVVYQYDSPGSRKGKQDNFQVICQALLSALPSRDDDAQERFNNFKIFRTFIKESKDTDLVPFRDILSKKLQALAQEKEQAKADQEKFERLQKEYESLKAEVVKRTEGI